MRRILLACSTLAFVAAAGCTSTTTGQPVVADGGRTSAPGPSVSLTFRKVVTTAPSKVPAAGHPPASQAERQSTDPQTQRRVLAEFDCAADDPLRGNDDPALPLVACDRKKMEKYLLAPVFLRGNELADAGTEPSPAGRTEYVVNLTFTDSGARIFADFTTHNVGARVALVLNSSILSAPSISQPIPGGHIQISGEFTAATARSLVSEITGR